MNSTWISSFGMLLLMICGKDTSIVKLWYIHKSILQNFRIKLLRPYDTKNVANQHWWNRNLVHSNPLKEATRLRWLEKFFQVCWRLKNPLFLSFQLPEKESYSVLLMMLHAVRPIQVIRSCSTVERKFR